MAKPRKKTKVEEAIEERLIRCAKQDPQEILYIRDLVEKTLKGEFGAILQALTSGRISMELDAQKISGKSSDYHIGRLSAFNDLWHDLEQYVIDGDKLRENINREDMSVESFNYSP